MGNDPSIWKNKIIISSENAFTDSVDPDFSTSLYAEGISYTSSKTENQDNVGDIININEVEIHPGYNKFDSMEENAEFVIEERTEPAIYQNNLENNIIVLTEYENESQLEQELTLTITEIDTTSEEITSIEHLATGDNQTTEITTEETENLEEELQLVLQARTSKRKSKPNTWNCNQRKIKHQAGEEYVNRRKKKVLKNEVKTQKNCNTGYKLRCATKIQPEERQNIFESYYRLDQNGKYEFIVRTTDRIIKNRCTTGGNSRRSYTFKYYFSVKNYKIEVCKIFYLSTLDISQKTIYNVHAKKGKNFWSAKKG